MVGNGGCHAFQALGLAQQPVPGFALLPLILGVPALGNVVNQRLEYGLPVKLHRAQENFGGKGKTRVQALVHPVKPERAFLECQIDHAIGQLTGIFTARLDQGR